MLVLQHKVITLNSEAAENYGGSEKFQEVAHMLDFISHFSKS